MEPKTLIELVTAMPVKAMIEMVAALTMPIAIFAIIRHRVDTERGTSARAIQFLAVATVIPLILILSLEGVLEKDMVGVLMGSLIGALLSNIKSSNGKGADKEKAQAAEY